MLHKAYLVIFIVFDSKILSKIGAAIPTSEEKVKLPYYMSSLDKVKPNEKSLTKWLKSHNKDITISEKLDGLSALMIITPSTKSTQSTHSAQSANKLIALKDFDMKLYKHGDGYFGQDISHLLVNNIALSKTGLNLD